MRQLIIIISIVIVFLSGCNNHTTKDEGLYRIINDLVKDSTINADIILAEINTIHDYAELLKDKSINGFPRPPQPFVIYYNRDYFVDLNKKGIITDVDIDFMYNQIKDTTITLDSLKIERRVIPGKSYITRIYKDTIGDEKLMFDFKNNYPDQRVVQFSNPINSINNYKSLISIWFSTDIGLRNEKTLLLKLENNNWRIAKILSTKYYNE